MAQHDGTISLSVVVSIRTGEEKVGEPVVRFLIQRGGLEREGIERQGLELDTTAARTDGGTSGGSQLDAVLDAL